MTKQTELQAVLPSDHTFRRLMQLVGPATQGELLARLVEDLQAVEQGLALALAQMDWQEIRGQSHVLVALAGAVGATPLQMLAEALNRAAHAQQAAALPDLGSTALPMIATLIGYVAGQQTPPDQIP